MYCVVGVGVHVPPNPLFCTWGTNYALFRPFLPLSKNLYFTSNYMLHDIRDIVGKRGDTQIFAFLGFKFANNPPFFCEKLCPCNHSFFLIEIRLQ